MVLGSVASITRPTADKPELVTRPDAYVLCSKLSATIFLLRLLLRRRQRVLVLEEAARGRVLEEEPQDQEAEPDESGGLGDAEGVERGDLVVGGVYSENAQWGQRREWS